MKDKNKASKTEEKTNVMRILDSKKIKYNHYCYVETGETNGEKVAAILGQDPTYVFKTLVTVAKSGANYVFVIPVAATLDLKKAARSVGVKSVAMIHVADINKITGYVRGGCSPVGMKKQFVTRFDESCLDKPTIFVSAGRIGTQIEASPAGLLQASRGETASLTMAE